MTVIEVIDMDHNLDIGGWSDVRMAVSRVVCVCVYPKMNSSSGSC